MTGIKRPENTKAELALIKTCLLKPELVSDIMSSVNGQMYWDSSNKIVFNTIKRMHDKDAPIDEATLRGHLNSTYDQIGGDDFFDGLHRLESFPDNWEEYAEGVKDTYVLRQVLSSIEEEEKSKQAFTKDEEEKVKQRLRDLGYID